ncbi:MAG: hypothetical protein ACLRFO_02870 [Alphaproteobacteria bacterium]
MKKLILFLFMLIIMPVQSAQIANVDYIHTAIADKWDITIPYNREITNVGVAANMKYLLTAVDVANEILNGKKTTDYGNGEFATMVAADTVATDTAVETLIQKNADTGYKFTATIDLSLYSDNGAGSFGWPVTEFGFDLGAAGTFYVDWGDGTTETIKKDNTDAVTYTHDYGMTSGTYTVKIGGMATDYSDDEYTPAISFDVDVSAASVYSEAITEISGSLGAIFPTLSDGSQPRFVYLFYIPSITEIPSGLFDGIHGAPVSHMFDSAFYGSRNLTSIPENLFSGIVGSAPYMFNYTFSECSGLTKIPENLFSGIVGGAPYMFASTFMWCSNLTSIPENLFAGITGAAEGMFQYTFSYCDGLTKIPENLFSGVTYLAEHVFQSTFSYCYSLTGPSARINGKYLYEIWPDATYEQVGAMYHEATGLDDYGYIPDAWKEW